MKDGTPIGVPSLTASRSGHAASCGLEVNGVADAEDLANGFAGASAFGGLIDAVGELEVVVVPDALEAVDVLINAVVDVASVDQAGAVAAAAAAVRTDGRGDVGAGPAGVADSEDAVLEQELVERDTDAELELGCGVVRCAAALDVGVGRRAPVDSTDEARTQEEVERFGLKAGARCDARDVERRVGTGCVVLAAGHREPDVRGGGQEAEAQAVVSISFDDGAAEVSLHHAEARAEVQVRNQCVVSCAVVLEANAEAGGEGAVAVYAAGTCRGSGIVLEVREAGGINEGTVDRSAVEE